MFPQIEIKITGSGTVREVIESLQKVITSLGEVTREQIEGDDINLEDATLYTEIKELL